jgi:hypothetical protein
MSADGGQPAQNTVCQSVKLREQMFVDQKVAKFYRLNVGHFDTPHATNLSHRCYWFSTAPLPSFEDSRVRLLVKVIDGNAKKYASQFF